MQEKTKPNKRQGNFPLNKYAVQLNYLNLTHKQGYMNPLIQSQSKNLIPYTLIKSLFYLRF